MLFALILKGKAAIWHLCPAGNQETAHPFFSQYLRGDMRIAMIAESQKPSTFVSFSEDMPGRGSPFSCPLFEKDSVLIVGALEPSKGAPCKAHGRQGLGFGVSLLRRYGA
jgi:hypothetical protein